VLAPTGAMGGDYSHEFHVLAQNGESLIYYQKELLNYLKSNDFSLDEYETGGGIINLHLLYIPTFLSARLLPQTEKEQIEKDFSEFKKWLWENYRQDDNFWKDNPYGWSRWEGILKFVMAEDHTHLLPDFKEYVNNLDSIRNISFSKVFPELSNLI
jgi:hypothetical protein